jgi:hypothetical protein
MAWNYEPSIPIYDERALDVFQNFSVSLSYSGTVAWSVSVTPAKNPSSTVSVSGSTISGYYNGEHHGGSSITYMKEDETYYTVTDWDNVVDAHEITRFDPPLEQYVEHTYTATATPPPEETEGSETTATFTIYSTFDWDAGKNALIAAIADTRVGKINTPPYTE